MATQGSSGAAGGHQQSISTDSDSPVDGIAGSHPGGIEPAGDDVNAGAVGTGPGKRHEGNSQQGNAGSKQSTSIAQGDQPKGAPYPGTETGTVGTQGPGGAKQGGIDKR
jgi:hypothetical protein